MGMKGDSSKWGMDTLAVHGGNKHTNINEHVFPIFQTSTFIFESVEQGANRFAGKEEGYIYSRLSNPTVDLLRNKLALLEGGESALIYSTGMGAVSSVIFELLGKGDHMVTFNVLYGCTDSLFREYLLKMGIEVTFVNFSVEEVKNALRENTKVVYLETPSNPTLDTVDIGKVVEIVKSYNPEIKVVVDNTFATPIYQKPLEMGADVVIHSCTKYIGGHGDVVAGAAVFKNDLLKRLDHAQNDIGTSISPFDAWLLIRGLKTLPLRMRKHTENAKAIVEFLKKHEKVEKVMYPGYSGIISFEVRGGIEAGKIVMENVSLMGLAVSLGNVDSLIEHPASMTHAIVPKEEREKIGITDGLVRLSVGIEDSEDLIRDLDHALSMV